MAKLIYQCPLTSSPFAFGRNCHQQRNDAITLSVFGAHIYRIVRPYYKSSLLNQNQYGCFSVSASARSTFQQVQHVEGIPSSADAITAAVNAVASLTIKFSHRMDRETKGMFSAPSQDFLELCQEQLAICDNLFGHNAKFTIYIRPAESYGTRGLELRMVAAHPNWILGEDNGSLVLVANYDSSGILESAESALLEKEAVEIPEINALVFPMSKDFFLVGILVAELITPRTQEIPRQSKVRAVRPEWPPRQGLGETKSQTRDAAKTSNEELPPAGYSFVSQQQHLEAKKIAKSLAIASVMDQRTLLLQQSSWKRGVHIGDLLEKVRGPLAAIRTLGKMLQPQLKRGEISSDVLQDILVQGEYMKDVIQQFQDVAYLNKVGHHELNPGQFLNDNLIRDQENTKNTGTPGFSSPEERHLVSSSSNHRERHLVSGFSNHRDREAPMPPVALAPLMHSNTESCDVSKLLIDLVASGSVLAHKKGKSIELKFFQKDASYFAAMDESQLRQVFSNLLEGSLQQIFPGGWVKVEVMHAPGGGVLVVIDNNGPDLSLMSQAQTLSPWGPGLQVNGGGKMDATVILSIGTELSVAQDILEQYGAVLRITSPYLPRAPSGLGGTRLEVWLPSPSTAKHSEN